VENLKDKKIHMIHVVLGVVGVALTNLVIYYMIGSGFRHCYTPIKLNKVKVHY
jgi:hypothetical protein